MLARLQVIFFNLPVALITKNKINLSKICEDLMHSLANSIDYKWENMKIENQYEILFLANILFHSKIDVKIGSKALICI